MAVITSVILGDLKIHGALECSTVFQSSPSRVETFLCASFKIFLLDLGSSYIGVYNNSLNYTYILHTFLNVLFHNEGDFKNPQKTKKKKGLLYIPHEPKKIQVELKTWL